MAEEGYEPKLLIKRFYSLQEERVLTYKLFEEGFEAYLKGAPNYNFPMYKALVHKITEGFQGISQEIVSIEKTFRDPLQKSGVATLINTIQDREKSKLDCTAQLQILRQNVVDHPDTDYSEDLKQLKQKISECVESITETMEDLKYETEEFFLNDKDG